MQTLITPAEVIDAAFGGAASGVRENSVTAAAIISAQRKFIRPVLGPLYDRLADESYAGFLKEYVLPALALYVKFLLLPTLAHTVGGLGVVTHKGANFSPSSARELAALRKRTRADAHSMMRRAVEHVEANPAAFPGYDPVRNILNRRSVSSDIVL